MKPRILLDTHVLLRWMFEAQKLSREQARAIEKSLLRGEPLAVSAMTYLELVLLADEGRLSIKSPIHDLLDTIDNAPGLKVLPLTPRIALEAATLRPLRDPADRVIAATANVENLRLVTSDQRIIDSGLVAVIE